MGAQTAEAPPVTYDPQGLPSKAREPAISDALNLDNFHVSEELLQELHEEHEQATDGKSPRSILYWWHCRLGHLPLAKLKLLADAGQILKCVTKVQALPCCLYLQQSNEAPMAQLQRAPADFSCQETRGMCEC